MFAVADKTNDELINVLYASRKLMQKFQLSLGQAASFNGNIDINGTHSTYASLFLNNSLNGINAAFRPDAFGNILTAAVPLKAGASYNPVLLSALQLLPEQMDSLVLYFGIADATAFTASVEVISVLYSYRILSSALNISITDLLLLIKAFGKPAVLRKWDPPNNKFIDASIQDALSFIQFSEAINSSGFSVNELLFVLGISEDPTVTAQISDDGIKQAMIALQLSLAKIDQENPVPKAQEIDEGLVKNKMLQVYNKDIVAELAGMLTGSIIYGITLQPAPTLVIPEKLKPKITYDKNYCMSQILEISEFLQHYAMPYM